MKIIMQEEIEGKDFCFNKGEKYKDMDGDELATEELKGKILVRQPNSPEKHEWWRGLKNHVLVSRQ